MYGDTSPCIPCDGTGRVVTFGQCHDCVGMGRHRNGSPCVTCLGSGTTYKRYLSQPCHMCSGSGLATPPKFYDDINKN